MNIKIKCIENNYNNNKFILNNTYSITNDYITSNIGNIKFNNNKPVNIMIGHIINFDSCRFLVTVV